MRCAAEGMRTSSKHLDRPAFLASGGDKAWCAPGSPRRSAARPYGPGFERGSSAPEKIIDIFAAAQAAALRRATGAARRGPSNSTASASTRPGGLGTRPMIDSDVTLLAAGPDSPTRPTVAAALHGKIDYRRRRGTGRRSVWKYVRKPRTSRSLSIRTSSPSPCRKVFLIDHVRAAHPSAS